MLLSHGFIPHNARHQKATLKETDDPKAQLRRGLDVSHCLSLEGAVVLRHSVKSLQPSEMKLGLSFFPRLVSWLLLAGPARHLHSHSWSGEALPTHDTKSALPGQNRINFKILMQCAIRSIHNPPDTFSSLRSTQTTLRLHCFVSPTLPPPAGRWQVCCLCPDTSLSQPAVFAAFPRCFSLK